MSEVETNSKYYSATNYNSEFYSLDYRSLNSTVMSLSMDKQSNDVKINL